VPPGPDGRIAPADTAALAGFGRAIARTEGRNLAVGAPGAVTDSSVTTAEPLDRPLDVRLPRPVTFDQIRLGEDITRGQHVEGALVQAEVGGTWQTLATVTTIGYTRLVTLPAPVTTAHLRVVVTQSRATPYLATFALYRTAS
jgi:alpha-L-fucosidase